MRYNQIFKLKENTSKFSSAILKRDLRHLTINPFKQEMLEMRLLTQAGNLIQRKLSTRVK